MLGKREQAFVAECLTRMPRIGAELGVLREIAGSSLVPCTWIAGVVSDLIEPKPIRVQCLIDLYEVSPALGTVCQVLQALHDAGLPSVLAKFLAADAAVEAISDGSADAPQMRQLLKRWQIGADYINARVSSAMKLQQQEASCSP